MDMQAGGQKNGDGRARRPRPRVLALLGVAIVAAILVTGTLLFGPVTRPLPTGLASPAAEAWSGLSLPAYTPVAEMHAERVDAAGISPETAFVLTSLTGTEVRALVADLETSPKLEFTVASGATPASVTVKPVDALVPGRVYRFALRSADGTLAGAWAFQTRAPLHVVTTLPDNATTSVPTTTGIEVTFDQDGAADIQPYFSIEPAVDGRFEHHGRTQVFVPSGLMERALYTVTVRHGLPLTGTDLRLERDVRFRFETAGQQQPPPVRIRIGREVLEASPGDRPVVGLEVVLNEASDGQLPAAPKNADVRVYRFPSMAATIDELRTYLDAPRWAEWTDPLVPTSGLPKVLQFTATLRQIRDSTDRLIVFPTRLPRGWYLMEVAGDRPAQAFLQVTNVSAWVAVLSDRTVAWVNDTVTGHPIAGARVGVDRGPMLGQTGRDGLLVTPTPDELVPGNATNGATTAGTTTVEAVMGNERTVPIGPAISPTSTRGGEPSELVEGAGPILVVRTPGGKSAFVPFNIDRRGESYRGEWSMGETPVRNAWWSLLSTDRTQYRRDDRIEAWGFLRGRDDGRAPTEIELRLVSTNNQSITDPPAIATTKARPNKSGAFTAPLTLNDAPLGTYVLQARVDGQVVSSTMVEVAIIRKPAYRLSIATRHVTIAGDRISAAIQANFFDGQPVPSTSFSVSDGAEMTQVAGPTDSTGRATIELQPGAQPESEGSYGWYLSARPTRPEEGEISAELNVTVFPSAVHLAGEGILDGRQLVLTGSLHRVDLARLEHRLGAGQEAGDPGGKAIRGAQVTAKITELVPVRRLVGYDYDYIRKVVTPHYEFDVRRRVIRTVSLKTGAGGAFRLSMSVPSADHEYEVLLRTTDDAGRVERLTIVAGKPVTLETQPDQPIFETVVGPRERERPYRVGETVQLTMTDSARPLPTGGGNRYLYIVAQQGLRSVTTTDQPRLVRRFTGRDVPGVFIIGVRFTGRTYAPKADFWALFDTSQRALKVQLTSDRPGYRPGETATIAVRTTDAGGRPVAASVTVRAVDEKLFVTGGATAIDPLDDLYTRVDSGIIRLTATHQVPFGGGPEGEGGATGGGREDFRDTAFFRQVDTDVHGRATVTLPLPDDLTSWRISASAVTASLQAGEGQLSVPVGLPFFVDAVIADEYLASDRPSIRLRAFGQALQAGDPVEFTVSSPSLGLAATHVAGTAFTDVEVPLPPLTVGPQQITVGATASTRNDAAGQALADRMTRTFAVVGSRFSSEHTALTTMAADSILPGGGELTTYTFIDAGRGRFVSLLESLARGGGPRADEAIAQTVARDLLIRKFGRDPASLPPAGFDPGRYPPGVQYADDDEQIIGAGMPLLPYGGTDATLAVRIAIVAPDRVDRDALRSALIAVRDDRSTTRELRIAVLAGLAALGEPAIADLWVAAAEPDLTIRERIYLALGYATAGDDATALSIERDLLSRYGQQLGAWTRLNVGESLDDTIEASALLALAAATVGDPVAASLDAYVEENPAHDALHALDEVGYVERSLERTPTASASFAYTVDGHRELVDLRSGRAFTLVLTAAQGTGLRLEPLTGQVGISSAWSEPVDPSVVKTDPALTLTRSVTPSGTIPTDAFVTVDLTARFSWLAVETGCYEVLDLVPSGLAPVARTDDWVSDEGVFVPYSIVGQRVAFCVLNDRLTGNIARMRYLARIVTPGTYSWEPAQISLSGAPESVGLVPPSSITIGNR